MRRDKETGSAAALTETRSRDRKRRHDLKEAGVEGPLRRALPVALSFRWTAIFASCLLPAIFHLAIISLPTNRNKDDDK